MPAMRPSPDRLEAGGTAAAVAAIIEEAGVLTSLEIVELAHNVRHSHSPGPCPAAPLGSCRTPERQRIEQIIRTAVARAAAGPEVRRIRAEIERALHDAADRDLRAAEPVLGTIATAAEGAAAAAVARLLPDRMSAEAASLLSVAWRSIRPERDHEVTPRRGAA